MRTIMTIEGPVLDLRVKGQIFYPNCWNTHKWVFEVPEPYQAGCYPIEGEVGVRTNTGRWGTNSWMWMAIEPLKHPYLPETQRGEG